ncbi:hypothetical protein GE09DRAFT_703247 [Coniochaeta sp. 2T2.1]|nr:hypothetical protein GE09DRAFT_703247 [Coniochaeta sp. 2T2.1]
MVIEDDEFDNSLFVDGSEYEQVEGRNSYLTAAPQSFAQVERSLPANQIWGGDIGLDPVGNAGGMASFNFSPASQPGSFFEGSAESPDMSGGSEINFNGTAGIANYTSTSISSAPESPILTRDYHDGKRPKKSAAFAHARDGSMSTSASSSGRGGAKGKPKRELRSASRTSKNKQERAAETSEEQKSRNSHNLVEKQYRNRLNAQFEDLLHTLPESSWSGRATLGDDGDDGRANNKGEKKRVSKAEVLDMARQRILFLEEENRKIERENEDLRRRSMG